MMNFSPFLLMSDFAIEELHDADHIENRQP